MRARAGYFTGVLLLAAGLGLVLGVGWGLAVAGAGLVVASVWLYDVDEPEQVQSEGVPFR
jgi:hypothetical protein